MDYAKPFEVITSMIDAGANRLALSPGDPLICEAIFGALLGAATTLAFTCVVTTGQPLVGAFALPIARVMIVLLGLELVTGSFALAPLAGLERKASCMTSTSTVGKTAATSPPIFLFFVLDFVRAALNMFVILTGIMLGAKVSACDWWARNQIPVALGNFVGGFGFVITGLVLCVSYKSAKHSDRCYASRRARGTSAP